MGCSKDDLVAGQKVVIAEAACHRVGERAMRVLGMGVREGGEADEETQANWG